MTCDYNCRPHIDKDDYDLGFIIWIQEGWWLNLLLFFFLKLFFRILYSPFQLLIFFCFVGEDLESNYQAEFVFPEVK